jgi:hypothetical protein
VRTVRGLRGMVLLATAAVVAFLMVVPSAAATDAYQANVTVLPFASYQDMAVDAGHGHLFVAGGDLVVVTDLDGHIVRTIDGQKGASGLALSDDAATLYVALNGAGAIAALSTAKLKETARYKVGSLCPRDLVLAQGRIWFSHECDGARAGFSSLQLDGGRPVVTQWGWSSFIAPRLAATRQWPDLLLVGSVTRPLVAYDISGGDPVAQLPSEQASPPRSRDFALTADGRQVVVAGDAGHLVLNTWGLEQVGLYPSGPQANAVAVGARDRVAAGVADNRPGAVDLSVYEAGASQPTWTFDLGGRANSQLDDTLARHGLAWGPGNGRLYAVTTLFDGSAPVLRVLIPSTYSATALTLTYLDPSFVGDPTGLQVHLGGQLTALTGVATGAQTLHLVRQDLLGEEHLPDVRTDADGNYDFYDTLRGPGLTTYTVSFDGAGDLGASQQSLSFDLSSP